MNILVIFIFASLCSTMLAQKNNGRKPMPKDNGEPVEGGRRNRQHESSGPFLGFINEGRFLGNRVKPRIPYIDEENRHRHVEDTKRGRHVEDEQRGRHVEDEQRGRHVEDEQRGIHDEEAKHGRHVEDEKRGHYVQENRGRQARQSHNTHITLQVPHQGIYPGAIQGGGGFQQDTPIQFPQFGNHHGNQGSGGFLQDTSLQFPGRPQIEQHPGSQGSISLPGGIVISGPGGSTGNHGGSGILNPFSPGLLGQSGNFLGESGFPVNGISATSSTGGPGGLSSSPESGLAGGLGGVYGGGYGFGLGGLIFGGPNGPVFAGNTALYEGFSGNPPGNDDFENPRKSNGGASQPDKTPIFRPVPPKGNFFDDDNIESARTKGTSHVHRGVTSTGHSKTQYPQGNGRTQEKNSGKSNGGETIGYVAFIFPRRPFHRENTQTTEHSKVSETPKTNVDAAASKTKTTVSAAPVIKADSYRPAPYFVPVPVHIPIDRPYPVLVPRPYPVQVSKPYPVAVPVREPVPYVITKPVAVPVAVPTEVSRPIEVPVLLGVNEAAENGGINFLLQPSIDTSILHKRSDKTDDAKFA